MLKSKSFHNLLLISGHPSSLPATQGDPGAGGGGEGQEEGGEGGGGQGKKHLVPGQYLAPINLHQLSTFLSTFLPLNPKVPCF